MLVAPRFLYHPSSSLTPVTHIPGTDYSLVSKQCHRWWRIYYDLLIYTDSDLSERPSACSSQRSQAISSIPLLKPWLGLFQAEERGPWPRSQKAQPSIISCMTLGEPVVLSWSYFSYLYNEVFSTVLSSRLIFCLLISNLPQSHSKVWVLEWSPRMSLRACGVPRRLSSCGWGAAWAPLHPVVLSRWHSLHPDFPQHIFLHNQTNWYLSVS